MFHQLCYDIDGSLLCANTIESHQVGMLKPSTWCKRKEVYEGACVCVHTRTCVSGIQSMISKGNHILISPICEV